MAEAQDDPGITDDALFLDLPGGQEVADWFGFIPSFHDATLERLNCGGGNATMTLRAFRMTGRVDPDGFFILDRHALVEIGFAGVTGLFLCGDAQALIFRLTVRRSLPPSAPWRTVDGPREGDTVVRWESTLGLEGCIHARGVRFTLRPL